MKKRGYYYPKDCITTIDDDRESKIINQQT